MKSTISKILSIILAGVAFYFLVWPFINSAISGNFYLKTSSEGEMTMSYVADVSAAELNIVASIENYNNIATEKQGEKNLGPFKNSISQETYDKIKAIFGEYRGMHLFVRQHNGYSFYYDSNSASAAVYNAGEKTRLFEFAEILTYIARGDEKIDSKRASKTYGTKGLERLDELYKSLNLQ